MPSHLDVCPRDTSTLTAVARLLAASCVALSLVSSPALANGGCLRGVNLAGAEFGEIRGTYGQDYIYPSVETIDYFAAKGFTSVRLPFRWERLQPVLNQPFDEDELRRLKDTVKAMRDIDIRVVLDPHNYARYDQQVIGSEAVPHAAFGDFWRRLASEFAEDGNVIFGLMNEPFDMPTEQWLTATNVAIAEIRAVGAGNLILVPGNAWSGAHSWMGEGYGGANGVVMLGVVDPADNYAYEVHQYFDDDFSGTKNNCSRASDAIAAVTNFTSWLRANGARGYLGEFGVPAEPSCIEALEDMVSVVETNRDVWIGWAYWAGGDWWPETEELNIQPTAAGDRPQLNGLVAALNDVSEAASSCPALERF